MSEINGHRADPPDDDDEAGSGGTRRPVRSRASVARSAPYARSAVSTLGRTAERQLNEQTRTWLAQFPASAPVVVVPIMDGYEAVMGCIESLLAHTQSETPILLLDRGDGDPRIDQVLTSLDEKDRFLHLHGLSSDRSVRGINLAFAWSAPRDVVVVQSDTIVPADWLNRLQRAAYYRTTIATATPFTNDGTFLSVPYRNRPVERLPKGMTAAQVDARIEGYTSRLYPIIPTPVAHCVYYKRSALDIVGSFDEAFPPGCGEEIDLAQRAAKVGFSHVLADDLFVFVQNARTTRNRQPWECVAEGEQLLDTRYPWYRRWHNETCQSARSPLALAHARARVSLLGHRIAIDARSVDGVMNGTQVVTLELVRALASHPTWDGHLTMIIADDVPRKALQGIDQLVDEVLRFSDLRDIEMPVFDLVHRPFQIPSVDELAFLRKIATRFVVTHLDCIAFANPSYAPDADAWASLRHAMQLSFADADGVAFISEDAAQDAAHQGLSLPEERVCVTYTGVDHRLLSPTGEPPAASDAFAAGPLIVMIGTNYRHKNQLYAVRLLKLLVQRHNWAGHLVIAGTDTGWAGSAREEAVERLQAPSLRSRIHYLGAVSEREKRWLYEHAALVLYPSIYEGFGLVPFEAAAVGTPALATRTTSVAEVLGDDVIYLDSLGSEAGVETVWAMMTDPQRGQEQVRAINARAARFTWEAVAARTLQFYRRLLATPPRSLATSVLEEIARDGRCVQQQHQDLQRDVAAMREEIRATRQWAHEVLEDARQVDQWAQGVLESAQGGDDAASLSAARPILSNPGRTGVPGVAEGSTPSDAAMLIASPNPVPDGPGSGSTTITWATPDKTVGQVWVSTNGQAEQKFTQGAEGSESAAWIQTGHTYTFTLYAGVGRTGPRLKTITVTRTRRR